VESRNEGKRGKKGVVEGEEILMLEGECMQREWWG
jgi:hypothetical protein